MISTTADLVPNEVLLGCKHCERLWVQSREQALYWPAVICCCPYCGEQLNTEPADKPVVVQGSKQ